MDDRYRRRRAEDLIAVVEVGIESAVTMIDIRTDRGVDRRAGLRRRGEGGVRVIRVGAGVVLDRRRGEVVVVAVVVKAEGDAVRVIRVMGVGVGAGVEVEVEGEGADERCCRRE